ncbi:MAG: DUF3089 domain-containing protein [Deltaproteobacteria bacterium]|nr:DUF3089 domain-containing protein [Deltaproteobacteria bacterium]
MRRAALGIGLLLLSATACQGMVRRALVPDQPFAQTEAPAAPDYADEASWAALPDREDDADVAPEGESDGQATAAVDVFFVHPTTYYDDAFWNQPLDDEKTNTRTDEGVMRRQASAFNSVGRIYAPRYRQATLGAYLAEDFEDTRQALDLAYGDVRRAFEHYLATWAQDRPLILASHSQGSGHMVRLVHEFLSGDAPANVALRARLVAVYAIGGAIPLDEVERTFPEIPVCATPEQTGCLLTYNSLKAGEAPGEEFERRMWYPEGWLPIEDRPLICVNPVTWRDDDEASAQAEHLGAVRFVKDELSPEPDPAWLTAACRADGYLDVDLLESRRYGPGTGGSSYHIIDYALFYLDLRRNAEARVAAFLP